MERGNRVSLEVDHTWLVTRLCAEMLGRYDYFGAQQKTAISL